MNKEPPIPDTALALDARRHWTLVARCWATALLRAAAIAVVLLPAVVYVVVWLGFGAWLNTPSLANPDPSMCVLVFAMNMVVAFFFGPWPDRMLKRELRRLSD